MCKIASSIAERKAQQFGEISADKSDVSVDNLQRAQLFIALDRTLAHHVAHCLACQREVV